MPEVSKLADFQDVLVELLLSERTESEIIETLNADLRFEEYKGYVENFDTDMVAVARELMGKWARRK